MSHKLPEKERLNIYLPKDLVEELRRQLPPRKRTDFIEKILRRELRRIRLKEAIDRSSGAWKDEDHPELATSKSIDRWIESGRSTLDWDRSLFEEE